MKTELFQILVYTSITLIAVGCQSEDARKVNPEPQTVGYEPVTVPEEVFQGFSALLAVKRGKNARARYEETYYCYVDEPFALDLNEPGEEKGNIRYEGMSALFRVDPKTGLIEFTPTDFEIGKWKPLIHVRNAEGRLLYWINLDFEVLKR